MYGAFSLVGLLVVLAIILFLVAGRGCQGQSYLGTVMSTREEKREMAHQWGGRDASGRPLTETVALTEWPGTGALQGLEVVNLDPTGAAATHYGLEQGDVILRIGPQDVGGAVIATQEDGEAFLADAYARSLPITVRRGESQLTLPEQRQGPAAAPAGRGGLPSSLQGLTPGTQ